MGHAASAQQWEQVRHVLLERIPGFDQVDQQGSLILPLADEDWFLEIGSDGLLICQAGYDLDDMKSLLSDGTPEDLGQDELAKQAKFYLQQTVSKYRNRLIQNGFHERIEMNQDYVAALFEKPVDYGDVDSLLEAIQQCRSQFLPPS